MAEKFCIGGGAPSENASGGGAAGVARTLCCLEPEQPWGHGCCTPAGVCGRRRGSGTGGDGRPLSVAVSLLLLAFGWSSWIAVNGLWVELPLLVNELPEYWSLPAYLTVIIQVANVGPLLYVVGLRASGRRMLSVAVPTVYGLMAVGAGASLLLAFFWRRTEPVGSGLHSVALLALAFCLALVDCTSSVTYVPFVGALRPQYMTAFYVGEGLSGLIPCVVALVQGAGEYDCVNRSSTAVANGSGVIVGNSSAGGNVTWQVGPVYRPVAFAVEDFFYFLCAMMVVSCIAFSLLAHLPGCKRERLPEADRRRGGDYSPAATGGDDSNVQQSDKSLVPDEPSEKGRKATLSKMAALYAVTALVSCITNGVLPSLQTYSVLPYGSGYYSLAVKLSQAANPLACFITFAFLVTATWGLVLLTGLASVMAAVIIWIASQSPTPVLVGTDAGGVMVVALWVVMTGIFSFVKVNLATELAKYGDRALLWYGASTQAGAAVGAVITFLVVSVFSLLKDAPPCSL